MGFAVLRLTGRQLAEEADEIVAALRAGVAPGGDFDDAGRVRRDRPTRLLRDSPTKASGLDE